MTMDIQEIETYLKERSFEVSSGNFFAFASKTKLRLHTPLIHVSGSNGKSLTAHYIASVFGAKYRVGLLLNSYLLSFREDISINGESIPEEDAIRYFQEHQKFYEKYELTAFEILVDIAYRYFNDQSLDLCVVECGMGGREDATNIDDLPTILSVITNVSLEHTEYLGTTRSEIALHCGGIIAKGMPVLIGDIEEGCRDALKELAAKKNTMLTRMDPIYLPHLVDRSVFHFDYPPYKDLAIQSFASYNVTNAAMAVECAKILQKSLPLSENELKQGLFCAPLKGRLEAKGNVVLDPACNPDAILTLRRCFQTAGRGKPVHVLFASKQESNISVMLPYLADACADITLTSFEHPSARTEMDYALFTEDHRYIENPLFALMTLQMEHPDEVVLATGCREFIAFLEERL